AAGAALALPPGAARQAGLADLGPRLRAAGSDPAWRRPGAVDQVLISLALTQAGALRDPKTADVVFGLFQLAGRAGPSFDADALTALGLAKTETARRTTHQALRLRARRDRLVREQVQAVMTRAAAGPASPGPLRHDVETRWLIRDFDVRIAKAEAALAKDGVRVGAPDLTPLATLQGALAADEAVLAMAPTAGGYAYMCVRRDGTTQSLVAADPLRLRLDTRLVQAALTATHAPNDRLDIQFPVEASVRLHDTLIRPFESCLKPEDRIVWLSGIAGAALPLSALLPAAPPKIAGGYDLAAADWLVRRHAVSYAGSAGAIVAARTARAPAADLDFLGIGDPVLRAGADEDPAKVRLRGTRLDALAPLPETKDELEASARGFRSARVLVQDAATERGLRGQMVGAYRYLSFATHGLLREDLQGLSEPALVLTPVTAADPFDDGLLTASEIADMNLRAAFVALSACNTANFDLTQLAQDLPALASAFAVAGVPSTLATLWPVNSEASKQVVAGVFADLRDRPGQGPAAALAEAQRRFLAAPPSRAYLHPRFWAPFVILGDGGPVRAGAVSPPALRSVEVLTTAGGEVLGLKRTATGTAARFISDADARGRQGSAVRMADDAGGEAWRQEDRTVGAAQVVAQLGDRLVAGGYRLGGAGRNVPTLEAYEDGARVKVWQGEGLARVDAFLLGGAPTGADRAVIVVGEVNLRDPPAAGGGRLHVLEFGASLEPRPLFEVTAPTGFALSSATITPRGSDLLITYTTRTAGLTVSAAQTLDDYDTADCLTEWVTWLELRDARTGVRRAAREIRGLSVVAALARDDGRVLLGGATRGACGEDGRATVVAVDGGLETRTVYADATLGASDVRTLAVLPGGRTFVAASKENVVTYRPAAPAVAAKANPFAVMPFAHTYSGLLLTLGRDGAASAPKLLDSGSNIYVTASATGRPGEILLGGALGGQAAIFHLAEESRPQ
ncbi:MAG: CHAT domain-containing protein, partial [Alphaproteobacteria bacterium]|nr:CHAT domain-containing protein [Alphaproteobacteria bacterium]